MAARLDQIPEVGDWIEYKILDKSIVVVRSKSGVKAFHNACRHRGVRLLRYDFKAGGIARDLQLTLNVDNVFDTDPPEFRGDPIAGQFGYLNSLTLGRLVQFGISKKF
jgi:hypothetical protein